MIVSSWNVINFVLFWNELWKGRVCGKERRKRIVSGSSTFMGEIPWQARVLQNRKHRCGGALIGREYIITAAHCISKVSINQITINLGEVPAFRDGTYVSVPRWVSNVSKAMTHPRYNNITSRYDAALLKLSSRVSFDGHIFPVHLPVIDIPQFQYATVSGWGRTSNNSTHRPVFLKKVTVPIVSNEECALWYYGTTNGSSLLSRITEEMLCAGYEEGRRDACVGDSGDPLVGVDEKDGRKILVGIASWGSGCGSRRRPGVYVRVVSVVQWINRIALKGMD